MEFDLSLIPIEFWIVVVGYYFLVIFFLKQRYDGNKDVCILLKIALAIIFTATPLVFNEVDNTSVIIIEAGLLMSAFCDVLLGLEKYTEKREYTILGLISATLSQILFFTAAIAFKFDVVFFIVSLVISGIFFLWPKKIFKEHFMVWLYQTFFLAAVIYSLFIFLTYNVTGIGILMVGQLFYLISDMILLVMRFWHYYFKWDVISKFFYYTAELVICFSVIFW